MLWDDSKLVWFEGKHCLAMKYHVLLGIFFGLIVACQNRFSSLVEGTIPWWMSLVRRRIPEQSSPWKWSKQLGARVVAAVKHTKYIELCKLHGARFFFLQLPPYHLHRIISIYDSLHHVQPSPTQRCATLRWRIWIKPKQLKQGNCGIPRRPQWRSFNPRPKHCLLLWESLSHRMGSELKVFLSFFILLPLTWISFFYPPLIFPQFCISFFIIFLIMFYHFVYPFVLDLDILFLSSFEFSSILDIYIYIF